MKGSHYLDLMVQIHHPNYHLKETNNLKTYNNGILDFIDFF
jgi:hypothetical protein